MKQAAVLLVVFLAAACQAPAPPAPTAAEQPAGLVEGIASGKTELVDLGHALNEKNPYWPGPGYDPFKFEIFATLEKDHVLSGKFAMDEHTGTHMDAPNHFVAGQVSVDRIPLKQLFGPAVVIDGPTTTSTRTQTQRKFCTFPVFPMKPHGFLPKRET
jgi:hypothetical protein